MIDPEPPVVVVGASSSGLFAASLLAQAGVPVQVYERQDSIKTADRTLIVTPEMRRALGFSPQSSTLQKVHTLELFAHHNRVPIRLDEPDLIIERSELIRLLAGRAELAGAKIVYGQRFVGLEQAGRHASVMLKDRQGGQTRRVLARAVIGADGANSAVAASLGVSPAPVVPVVQTRVQLPQAADPGVGRVWFIPRHTRYFYWLCPESDRSATIGLVHDSAAAVRPRLDRFVRNQGLKPGEYQAALIPLYQPRRNAQRRIGRTPVLLVGDAGGHVKVTTVGGTVTGLRAARAAAQSIINESSYNRELAPVSRELLLHWLVRTAMNHFGDAEYEILLEALRGRAGRLLQVHNRDQIAGAFWPILAAQPRLPLLAAQVLWRAGLQG
jgi:geranylgeranyl diphosphate/geranylgeranyl-bacteriochlorophyllide a reductase